VDSCEGNVPNNITKYIATFVSHLSVQNDFFGINENEEHEMQKTSLSSTENVGVLVIYSPGNRILV
jgi:hypothetical protein